MIAHILSSLVYLTNMLWTTILKLCLDDHWFMKTKSYCFISLFKLEFGTCGK